jgi:hypothetical protein
MYAAPDALSQDNRKPAWLTSLLEARVPLVACVAATVVLAGGLYFYFEPAPPKGGNVYMPSSLPGPVASVVPAPAVAVAPPPGPAPRPPSPPKITPAVLTTPVPPSAPAPALAGKPNWCSEDHLKEDELTICATEDLWALDAQLNDVFRKVSDRAPDAKDLGDDEAKWVRETRRPCAANQGCIAHAYKDRIVYFTAWLKKE